MNYRIDLFAVFIFMGIVQAVFLLFFFFSGENRKRQVNMFQGLLLICITCCILEIFLMYTGYIINCLYLVDFSEVFALLIGPCFYLVIISLIRGRIEKKQYWHFVFPFIYLLLQLPFLLLPQDAKYNAWMIAYPQGLPLREFDMPYHANIFFLTDHHTALTILSLFFYAVLGLTAVAKVFREKSESFWKPVHPVLRTLRQGLLQNVLGLIIILIVKLLNKQDSGDHIVAAYLSLTIYFTSFSVVRRSGFFLQPALQEQQKYKGSNLTSEQLQTTLDKLKQLMDRNKVFLQPGFSLPALAQQMGVSVHALSQVINEGLGKSFFELAAEYRIDEAKRLLKNQPHLKVEEIAGQVGYHSKSSFNSAFKRITGKTPAEYRDEN
jgi:AraC-like DNA-binding protein